jgi:methylated-DNA-[protein]-cysteine S-methyltransferase
MVMPAKHLTEMEAYHCVIPSPLGRLRLLGTTRGLSGLAMEGEDGRPFLDSGSVDDASRFSAVIHQLREYFDGRLRRFEIPLDLRGTAFQLRAWRALMEIPYGQTCSYGAQALAIGQPRAVRAVGLANGRNPLPIVIPCHRVVGKNGLLTGYSGGLERKRFLLDLESHSMGCSLSRSSAM